MTSLVLFLFFSFPPLLECIIPFVSECDSENRKKKPQHQWSDVYMNFLCCNETYCSAFFLSHLSKWCYSDMAIAASSVQGRSFLWVHSNRCVVFVFLAFILQFRMNIMLHICISVQFEQVELKWWLSCGFDGMVVWQAAFVNTPVLSAHNILGQS